MPHPSRVEKYEALLDLLLIARQLFRLRFHSRSIHPIQGIFECIRVRETRTEMSFEPEPTFARKVIFLAKKLAHESCDGQLKIIQHFAEWVNKSAVTGNQRKKQTVTG